MHCGGPLLHPQRLPPRWPSGEQGCSGRWGTELHMRTRWPAPVLVHQPPCSYNTPGGVVSQDLCTCSFPTSEAPTWLALSFPQVFSHMSLRQEAFLHHPILCFIPSHVFLLITATWTPCLILPLPLRHKAPGGRGPCLLSYPLEPGAQRRAAGHPMY